MNEKTMVLIHDPQTNKRWEHYAIEADGVWRALCTWIESGDYTSKGQWTLAEMTSQHEVCGNCRKIHNKKVPQPHEPLPCTEPEKLVTLWTREGSEWARVHSCAPGPTRQSRCGVKNPSHAPDRWTKKHAQPARLVTCSFCLKAEGLYEGHPAYKHKAKKVKVDTQAAQAKEWQEKLAAWGDTG